MNYDEYVALAHQGAEADAAGDFEKAVNIFYQLFSTDISDVDKAMMCHNIGVIKKKMGKEQEALASFERGMSYERAHGRIVVANSGPPISTVWADSQIVSGLMTITLLKCKIT